MGIPLKVNRNIWSNKRFEVYASAGGAVENVYLESEALSAVFLHQMQEKMNNFREGKKMSK